MLFLSGTLLIIVAYLLSIYYTKRANEDDYNRPSFFNSKFRKYLLAVIIACLFLVGTFLLYLSGLYWSVFIILLLCYFGYNHYKMESFKNSVIENTLKWYRVFKNPDIAFETTEQLTFPIGFMLSKMNVDKKYREKVDAYLNKRIKEGEFTLAKQIPQEAWSVMGCINKEKIVPSKFAILEQKRIDYFYEEILEGKEHHNLKNTLLNLFYILEMQFERLFKDFSFITSPRPDFTSQEIELVRKSDYFKNPKKGEEDDQIAIFPEIKEWIAIKLGWVKNREEYFFLSGLEYSRRFPEHKFSKAVKKKYKFSKQKIFDYAQNWEQLDTEL